MSGIFAIDLFRAPDCVIIEEEEDLYPLPPVRGALPATVEPRPESEPVASGPQMLPAVAPVAVGQLDAASVVPYAVLGAGALAAAGIIWWAARPPVRQNPRRRRRR